MIQILFYEAVHTQLWYVVNMQYAVLKLGGPDRQLRSEDEMKETAGEECMFRDGWTEGILQLR